MAVFAHETHVVEACARTARDSSAGLSTTARRLEEQTSHTEAALAAGQVSTKQAESSPGRWRPCWRMRPHSSVTPANGRCCVTRTDSR